jgi:energy-coupling factor transporter ATP-binding protein EcfA2
MPNMLEMSKKKSMQEEVAELIRDVDIPRKQNMQIKEIVEGFDLTETIARALLLKHLWNKE